jgi:hypothetical protein
VIDNISKVAERFALIGVGIKRGNNKKEKIIYISGEGREAAE